MKASVTKKFGSPAETIIEERPVPVITKGHSIIKMHAATINQLSHFIRSEGIIEGASVPMILGNEGAGTVLESEQFTPGARVVIYGGNLLGITKDGLFQEYVLVENSRLIEFPDTLSFEEAAAVSVNYSTAWRAMTKSVQVSKGDTVLIAGATGSVGHAALQLSLALGATPIALVSTHEKADFARAAGAKEVLVLSEEQDLPAAIKKLTGGKGADYGFDPVGGGLTTALMQCLAFRGTLVSLGFAGGKQLVIEAFDIIAQEKQLKGYSLHAEKDEDMPDVLKELMKLAAEGKVRPVIDSSYSLEQVDEGYARLSSRKAMGSIVLTF